MGIIGRSTRANRPNRRSSSGRLLGSTCGLLEKIMGGRLIGHGRLIGIIRYILFFVLIEPCAKVALELVSHTGFDGVPVICMNLLCLLYVTIL